MSELEVVETYCTICDNFADCVLAKDKRVCITCSFKAEYIEVKQAINGFPEKTDE